MAMPRDLPVYMFVSYPCTRIATASRVLACGEHKAFYNEDFCKLHAITKQNKCLDDNAKP